MSTPPLSSEPWHLACLCAAWCRLCDGYRQVFDEACAVLGGEQPGLRRHWIDIEDEAELVGELDVETFPTLVLAGPDEVWFAGTLTPQPQTLLRVLRAALHSAAAGGPAPVQPAAVQDFAARLRHRSADA